MAKLAESLQLGLPERPQLEVTPSDEPSHCSV
jgi:hypothetical protein